MYLKCIFVLTLHFSQGIPDQQEHEAGLGGWGWEPVLESLAFPHILQAEALSAFVLHYLSIHDVCIVNSLRK